MTNSRFAIGALSKPWLAFVAWATLAALALGAASVGSIETIEFIYGGV